MPLAAAWTRSSGIGTDHFGDSMASRRIAGNFNQGWGVAAFITLLAAAGFFIAFTIYSNTYHHPTDPTAPTTQGAESH